MTLEEVFLNFGNFLSVYLWGINQFFKLFFNDITIFDISLGWWFLMFLIINCCN